MKNRVVESVITGEVESMPLQRKTDIIGVREVYLDGKLKNAELIDEDEKSFGIFMHSLILSNYAEVMQLNPHQIFIRGDEYEKAIYRYTTGKGFDKNLIESIAPRVPQVTFPSADPLKQSAHLINEKIRIVSKGTPDVLLERCSYILMDSKLVKMTRRICREVNEVLRDMMSRCVNVYAIALKDMSRMAEALQLNAPVHEMTLVALVGMR